MLTIWILVMITTIRTALACNNSVASLLEFCLEMDAFAFDPHLGDKCLSRQHGLHEASFQNLHIARVVATIPKKL